MASVITNISIKNIKGYGDPATSITLELKTNRVNIIYAPNGTGKSSIVAAFRSLNRNTLSPLKDDMYHKDETLLPELSIMMDGRTYSADKVSNTINPVLEPYVINSGTIVNTVRQNIGGKYTKVSGYLDIENIVVINNIPPIVRPHYRITEIRTEFGKNGKILTRRDDLFANNTAFWKACEEIGPKLDFFRSAQFRRQLVDNIKVAIQTLEGTTDYIKNNVQDNWFEALERNRVFDEIMQGLNFFAPKSRQEHRPRLDGKIRSTAERKIFPAHPCGGLPALAKAGTVGYFCSKIVPQEVARLNGAETPE